MAVCEDKTQRLVSTHHSTFGIDVSDDVIVPAAAATATRDSDIRRVHYSTEAGRASA